MLRTSVRALALSSVLAVTACIHTSEGVAKALVSDEQEAQLGAQVKQELDKQGTKYIQDPEIVNYVRGVAQKVFLSADKDRPGVKWQVYVIDDPKQVNAFATPRQALIAVTTDVRFVCPSRKIARAAKMGQSAPVWRYFFTHALDSGAAQVFGAWHGLEVTFLFGALRIAGYVPSAAEEKLSADMIGYWSRLAKTRDPNGGNAAPWPLYDATSDSHLVLDDPITSSTGLRTARCDFWDSILP